MASITEWGDRISTGRPACGAVPAAWAVAEARHSSGRELLTAVVAGLEVEQRVALAVQPSPERRRERGWGETSWQVFAAILPAAKLMGLDAAQCNQAIGLGTACSVIPAAAEAGFIHYAYGLRARDGVIAAGLVERGIQSLMDGLDDKAAYGVHMTDAEDETWYARDLGALWLTANALPDEVGSWDELEERFLSGAAEADRQRRLFRALRDVERCGDVALLSTELFA